MSTSAPHISIGVPVYNSQQHVREALNSLLSQDYGNFEIIISDNGSTDNTRQICLDYVAQESRIRYYRSETNMGMSWNMNRVLTLAQGKYFKWAGSHDFVAPSFISKCLHAFKISPNIVLTYPLVQAVDDAGEPMNEILAETLDTTNLPDYARLFTLITKIRHYASIYYGLYNTAALRRCRPIRAFMGNDQVLLMELSILGSIAVVPEVLLFRRYFGRVLPDRERIVTDLIRMNPQVRGRTAVRPIWELARESVAGTLRLASFAGKLRLTPVVACAFYSRWRRQLRDELLNPYSLQQSIESN